MFKMLFGSFLLFGLLLSTAHTGDFFCLQKPFEQLALTKDYYSPGEDLFARVYAFSNRSDTLEKRKKIQKIIEKFQKAFKKNEKKFENGKNFSFEIVWPEKEIVTECTVEYSASEHNLTFKIGDLVSNSGNIEYGSSSSNLSPYFAEFLYKLLEVANASLKTSLKPNTISIEATEVINFQLRRMLIDLGFNQKNTGIYEFVFSKVNGLRPSTKNLLRERFNNHLPHLSAHQKTSILERVTNLFELSKIWTLLNNTEALSFDAEQIVEILELIDTPFKQKIWQRVAVGKFNYQQQKFLIQKLKPKHLKRFEEIANEEDPYRRTWAIYESLVSE